MAELTGGSWSNWSGAVTCTPARILRPAGEAEVAAAVRAAARDGHVVRVAGAGHSFTPLVATDGVLLDPEPLAGIVAVHPAAGLATIRAGTRIHAIGAPLAAAGLALANQGDVDVQAIAGALGTGTHGTGRTLGSLSTQIERLRLVDAEGGFRTIDAADGELFDAARLSLGMLGVTVEVTLRCVPAYRLHERTWLEPVESALARLSELAAQNRHFEFFWRPQHGYCDMKALNPTDAPADSEAGIERPARSYASPTADGSIDLSVVHERIAWSFEIFPSVRNRRFNEMEFAVPEENGPACFEELRRLMTGRYPEIDTWPIEYRTQAADTLLLSPAQGRAVVTLSIHQAADKPHEAFFRDAEAIFRNHRGRPHWGKMHWMSAADLAASVPGFERFRAIRRALDPAGRFLNSYLRGLFG